MSAAMQDVLARWRRHAWSVVGDVRYPDSTRQLAWRFLKQHGVV